MRPRKNTQPLALKDWQSLAETRIRKVLSLVESDRFLRRLASRSRKKHELQVGIQLVGSSLMSRLNQSYRNKSYATDVLSFPAPEPFQLQGVLGELVICLPTLKSQAKQVEKILQQTQGKQAHHGPGDELDVLLVHGVLHLLGMDHELGPEEAKRMAQWEKRLLKKLHALGGRQRRSPVKCASRLGLIERTESGKVKQ